MKCRTGRSDYHLTLMRLKTRGPSEIFLHTLPDILIRNKRTHHLASLPQELVLIHTFCYPRTSADRSAPTSTWPTPHVPSHNAHQPAFARKEKEKKEKGKNQCTDSGSSPIETADQLDLSSAFTCIFRAFFVRYLVFCYSFCWAGSNTLIPSSSIYI